MTDLRTLMIEIAPPDLDQTGMDGALRKLLEPLPARGIEVELDAGAATHLPPDKTSLVFRVAQEAIRNVVNHSQATKVTTRLRLVDGTVTLQVDDNGQGVLRRRSIAASRGGPRGAAPAQQRGRGVERTAISDQ